MFDAYVPAPTAFDEAQALVEALIMNPSRSEPVAKSIRFWDQAGCHFFAQAAKNCYEYDQRNRLGDTLRSLANNAIITEHRRAIAA